MKRQALLFLILCVLASIVQAEGSGVIIGWGASVVGADLSKDFIQVAACYKYSLGLLIFEKLNKRAYSCR